MKQTPESFSSTKYHVAYHEVNRWLTHGPTMRATGDSRTITAGGPLPWEPPVVSRTVTQEVGPYHEGHWWLPHRHSGAGLLPWQPPVVCRNVIQEVGPYHDSRQWSHAYHSVGWPYHESHRWSLKSSRNEWRGKQDTVILTLRNSGIEMCRTRQRLSWVRKTVSQCKRY